MKSEVKDEVAEVGGFRLHASHFKRSAPQALVIYAALTLVLTWPLARGITRDLPADFGDPVLNSWVLAWDADHLLRALSGQFDALRGYWDANIYYPHPLALAYSEHLTAQAVMILPVYALSKNPILSYNVVFLLTFMLSALGMFLLVRELTGSTAGAFLAGLAFGFAPYRFGTLPHVQVLSSMWMPLTLLGFHRFLETRRRWPLAGAVVAWIFQNLSCGYYLLFFSPVVALYLALELSRRRLWPDRFVLIRLVTAIFVVMLATVPFLLPYWELRQLGFNARSLAETTRFSADVLGYFTTDVEMRLWGSIVRAWPRSEGYLFPGFTIATLAAVGIIARWRHARAEAPSAPTTAFVRVLSWLLTTACVVTGGILAGWSLHFSIGGVDVRLTSLDRGLLLVGALTTALLAVSPRVRAIVRFTMVSPVGTLIIITLFAFAMSLGPEIYARGRSIEAANIYSLFYFFVPGFDGLRVPARYAMIVALGLAALAGYGAALIAHRPRGQAVVALAAVFMVAESWAVPIPVNVNSTTYRQSGLAALPERLPAVSNLPAVYRFVALLPPSSALIELPFGEVAFETRYMFNSTFHWRRLVNGYSGGGPDEYGVWAERLKELPSQPDAAWRAVVDSRATHLIVHEGSYMGDRGRLISAWAVAHGAREIGAFDSDRIFAIE